MAVRKGARKSQPNGMDADKAARAVDERVNELAEQLGWFLGRVQAKADDWMENPSVRKQVTQIRDGANELLKHVNRGTVKARQTARVQRAAKKAAAR